MSKCQGKVHDVYVFSLPMYKLLEDWPEKDIREQRWANVYQIFYLPIPSKNKMSFMCDIFFIIKVQVNYKQSQ